MSVHVLIVNDAPDVRRLLSAVSTASDQGWTLAVDSAANPVPPRRFIPDMVTAGSDGRRACRIVGDVGGRVVGMVHGHRRAPAARRCARGVTVAIVQSLVAAKMALHWGALGQARRLLDAAPHAARGWEGFSSAPPTARGPGRWSAAVTAVSIPGR